MSASIFITRATSCGPVTFQAIGFCETDIEASESMAALDIRSADAALAKARKEGNEVTVERLEVTRPVHGIGACNYLLASLLSSQLLQRSQELQDPLSP